jgi:hypothetical protein
MHKLIREGREEDRLQNSVLNLAHAVDRNFDEISEALVLAHKHRVLAELAAAFEVWHVTTHEILREIALSAARSRAKPN